MEEGRKKTADNQPSPGRPSGLSTKVHVACPDERTGVSFELRGGERHDAAGFEPVWEEEYPMAIEIAPLPNGAGVRILGADLSLPIGESDFADIYAAYLEWSNILIPGQGRISPAHYQAFCARFGKIMPGVPSTGRQKRYRKRDIERAHAPKYTLAGYAGIFVLTNEEIDGKPAGLSKAGLYWHSDLYYREVPAKVTFLFARRVPRTGGETGILNTYRVYDAMPDALKRRIAGLRVWHSWVAGWSSLFPTRAPLTDEEIADTPDVIHPLVCRHPESLRPTLYIGALAQGRNPGLEIRGLPRAEAQALYEELKAFVLRPEFVYVHHWQAGDLLANDNISAMHCAMPFDDTREIRTLHRITIEGVRPSALRNP